MVDSQTPDNRRTRGPDRRRFPRGGRRAGDRPGKHPTIALVEPYEGVRRPCARYLDHFNFDVVEAADVNEGLSILQRTTPALLLVGDDQSPSATALHAQARARTIPFVQMTAAFTGESMARAEAAGAAGVLVKPFPLGVMLEEIRRVLRARMAV